MVSTPFSPCGAAGNRWTRSAPSGHGWAVTARNLAIDRVRRRRETDAIPDHLPDSPAGPRRAGGAEPAPQSAPTAGGQHGGADRTLFRRYYFEEEPLHQVAKELGLNQATAQDPAGTGTA